MAAATITVDEAAINDALARLLAAAGNIKPALKNIGEFEAKVTRRRFIDQRDPDGAPWAALNPLYAKTKKGPGILRGETRSLSQIVWQLAGDGVEIGSNEVYARIHNEGGTIRPKTAEALVFSMGGQTFKVQSVKIPKRQFLGFNEASIAAILDIVKDHFVEAIEQK
ncbi:phage virion morphogenesis protein [Rhizobium sp. Leaf341]|uniref:phage virion morphogenesis protein n=1 Tax=Rhizobium sp. Leaf341 TaxID=1736344 RepID=UPI0007152E62|nr:phage virion morphogenesis protein [Rhizobium sp. Leaf341]KQR75757.1 virion morphogenesis protein [Rhizobium sp. Leaf341]